MYVTMAILNIKEPENHLRTQNLHKAPSNKEYLIIVKLSNDDQIMKIFIVVPKTSV
jgi:hypothetical protein